MHVHPTGFQHEYTKDFYIPRKAQKHQGQDAFLNKTRNNLPKARTALYNKTRGRHMAEHYPSCHRMVFIVHWADTPARHVVNIRDYAVSRVLND
jgi:hypothetical protein